MYITSPSFTFTRPANTTAYAAGNLIANSTTAGSVVPMSWTLGSSNINFPCTIKRATIRTGSTTISGFKFNLNLWSAAPTVANGDGGALSATGSTNFIGWIQCDGTTNPGAIFSDGAVAFGAMTDGAEANFQLPSGNTIYGLLSATGAYTPVSADTIKVTLDLIEHYPRGG